MGQIGFFGGTFDPIHNGHLNLALEILEKKKLSKILFSPAFISPTKQQNPPVASGDHRMNMLRLSLEDIKGCEPYGEELVTPSPSYTIDTISKINADKIYIIMAEDLLYDLEKWKDVKKLFSIASPLIGTRHGFRDRDIENFEPSLKLQIKEGLCSICAMDISSTMIRSRLKKRLYCGHLLQGKVLDYIHQNELYFS